MTIQPELAPPPTSPPIATGTLDGPTPPDWRFGLIATAIYFLVLLPRTLMHVMWRDEWQAWMLVSDAGSFGEMLGSLRYEGHPWLWHILLYPLHLLWNDPAVMQVAHAVITAGVALLIAVYLPVPRWARVLLLASYWFAFEYATISRNYSIGVLPLFASCVLQRQRPGAYIGQGVILAIAVQTNAFAMILACVLGLVQVWTWFSSGRRDTVRFLIGGGILVAGLVLAVAQLAPPDDRAYAEPFRLINVERGGRVVASYWRSFVPVMPFERTWRGDNFLDFTFDMGPAKFIQPLLGIVLFAAICFALPRRVLGVGFFLVGGLVFALFQYAVFPGGLRHQGHLVMLAIMTIWISGGWAVLRKPQRQIWTGLLAISAFAGIAASIADLARPFSAAPAIAQYIEAEYPADVPIVGHVDFAASSVAGNLDRPIWYLHPQPGRLGTFMRWDNRRNVWVEPELLTKTAEHARAASPDQTVLLVMSEQSLAGQDESFVKVAEFKDATDDYERFTLYEYRPAPVPTTAPAGE